MGTTTLVNCRLFLVRDKYAVQFAVNAKRRSYTSHAYIHRGGEQPLLYKNLGQQVQRAAEKYAKRPAVISCHEDSRLTFAEAKAEAEILAVKLKGLGLQRGEHLGLWAPNTIQWYISFMAAALAGFPLVCINPALQPNELEYALRKAKVRTLITMDECGKQNFCSIISEVWPRLKADVQTEAQLLQVLLKSSARGGAEFLDYDQLMKTPTRTQDIAYLNAKIPEISAESPCNVQFTSGTTGQPKAALLTHFNYTNVGHYFGRYLRLHESHKHICFTVPFFHAFGLGVLMAALDHGATLVLPSPTFNAPAALEAIEKERCHLVLGTPTMFVDLIEQQRKLQKSMQSLELGMVGGAACSPEVFTKSKAVLRLREMRIGYGLSESTSAIFTQDGMESDIDAVQTVGKLYEHGEAKVINDKGETVAFGEAGELCVRGFFTMRGYFEDEEQTREVLGVDGWLKTGDEFVLESTGIGRIVGRKKDMIIRGGENIFPKEIEDFLDTHPSVLEAQIIGVPDERLGEEVCAYLRLRPEVAKLSTEDIKEYCKGKLAHFKIPRYVRVVVDFPKTNSGKIQKFKLRESFRM